jgi:putative phage-type endonuclease
MLPEYINEDEWHQRRIGKVTASRIADVVAKTKTGWGASRANYMAQLIAERMTGVKADSFSNAAMQWGIDKEADAIAVYEFEHDRKVVASDFMDHPWIANTGASPDGLVGDDGLIECKCPNTSTHIETLLSGSIDQKYVYQMQWQMACTGRLWCDFVSFDPRMPADLQLWVRRVDRDDDVIAALEKQVQEFLAELGEKVRRLEALRAAA